MNYVGVSRSRSVTNPKLMVISSRTNLGPLRKSTYKSSLSATRKTYQFLLLEFRVMRNTKTRSHRQAKVCRV